VPVGLLYALIVAIWGSSWIGIEFQLGVVAPELSIAYRFVLAAALLLGFCVLRRRRLRFSARDHAFMAAQGVTLFSINYVLFYVAAGYLTSGLMAVAFSTIVVMNIGNGALLFGHRAEPLVALAALAGIAGLGLVFWPEIAGFELSRAAAIGLGLSLVATYSASLGNMVTVRHKPQSAAHRRETRGRFTVSLSPAPNGCSSRSIIVSITSFSLIFTICIFSSSISASGRVSESTSSRPSQRMTWQKSSRS